MNKILVYPKYVPFFGSKVVPLYKSLMGSQNENSSFVQILLYIHLMFLRRKQKFYIPFFMNKLYFIKMNVE